MIVTVSTVEDDVDNLRAFVDRNLARGVDHMVLFLDSERPEVARVLEAEPSVSVVRAEDWWLPGERPAVLNRRQSVNASTVNAILTACPWATWLFHIDGDEVLDVDAGRLRSLGPEVSALELPTLEVLNPGTRPADASGVTLFKRPPTEDQLVLLAELGYLARPSARQFYRGHFGKCGLRPDLARSVAVHRPFDADGKVLGHQLDGMRLLHLESATFEEFERKWRALLASSPEGRIGMRPRRRALATAVRALLASPATDEVRSRYLRQLYDATAVDRHADALVDLGLVEAVHLDRQHAGRSTVAPAQLDQLRSRLARARGVRKGVFASGEPARRAEVLARLEG